MDTNRIITLLKDNIRLLIGLFVVIFIAILVLTFAVHKKTPKVMVNNKTFNVLLAKTDKDKQIGLSNREKLPDNQGMLFLFDSPDYYSFWMKEMKFPIDIVYIQGDKVTTVVEGAKPPTQTGGKLPIYQPTDSSDKVLEINSGLAQKYNIKKGTSIKVENL